MGIIIRQSFKSSIVSYLGIVIGMVNVIFLSARYLSPEQLAIMRVIIENSLLFVSLAQLGAPHIAVRFFPFFQDEKNKHKGFLFFLLLYCSIGFFIFLLIYLFGKPLFVSYFQEKSPELIPYYFYVVPFVFFSLYLYVLEAYSQIHGRIVVPNIIKDLFLKLANTFLIILFALQIFGFDGFLNGFILAYGIAPLLMIIYLQKQNWLFLQKDFTLLKPAFLKEIIVYGLYIVIGGIGYLLATRIDLLMIASMVGLKETAVYSIALFIAVVIEIPKRSVAQITAPILSQALKENNFEKVGELYSKSALNQLIFGLLIFLLIWCNIDAIFSIIPKSEIYSQGKFVVFFIGIAKLIEMASGMNNEIILNSKYYRFGLVTMVLLAGLTITTNYIFIPLYGINGAAFATALSIFIFTLIRVIFVQWKFKLHPYSPKFLSVILFAVLAFFVVWFLPEFGKNLWLVFLNIAVKSTIILLVFILLIYRFRISEDIHELIDNYLKNIFKRNPR